MIGPHTQGRRSADHFALLGLTGVANRKSGDETEEPKVGPATFAVPVTTRLEEPIRQEPRVEEARMARQVLPPDQTALRKYAATLLSDVSEASKTSTKPSTQTPPAETFRPQLYTDSVDRLSPFTMAAMLMFAGLLFLFLIPPVGLTFLLCAVLPLVWGAGGALAKS